MGKSLQTKAASDVIVVGGGVIGLSIARALASRNVEVVLLERGELGAEASYAAGGILGPQAEADAADDFFKLACQSRDLYPAWASALLEETGIDIQLDTTGTLYLSFTEEDEMEVDRRFEWQNEAGLTVFRLSGTEARQLEPVIADEVRSGLRFPDDIQVDNRRLLSALVTANQKLGVTLLTSTAVESLQITEGRITGVVTSVGLMSASRVVLAAGAWTSILANAESRANSLPAIRIQPVRGQMACLQTDPRIARHILYSPRGYLVPRRDGRVLAGSTSEQAGFVKEVTAGGLAEILGNAFEIAPTLRSRPVQSTWAGLRPCTEDKLPVIGPSGVDGLFYATGHYRNGILLAPITAELMADAIVNDVISPLLSRFSPNRFDLISAH